MCFVCVCLRGIYVCRPLCICFVCVCVVFMFAGPSCVCHARVRARLYVCRAKRVSYMYSYVRLFTFRCILAGKNPHTLSGTYKQTYKYIYNYRTVSAYSHKTHSHMPTDSNGILFELDARKRYVQRRDNHDGPRRNSLETTATEDGYFMRNGSPQRSSEGVDDSYATGLDAMDDKDFRQRESAVLEELLGTRLGLGDMDMRLFGS